MTHTIRLWRVVGAGWIAVHSDPRVRELFGTDTLPTPFTAHMDGERVRAEIQARNPGVHVILRTGRA